MSNISITLPRHYRHTNFSADINILLIIYLFISGWVFRGNGQDCMLDILVAGCLNVPAIPFSPGLIVHLNWLFLWSVKLNPASGVGRSGHWPSESFRWGRGADAWWPSSGPTCFQNSVK